MTERKPLDATAFAVMLVCTALWGFQQVVIKATGPDISFVMQSGIRSVIATALVLFWILFRKIPLWEKDGTLWPGIAAGLLFGGEFVFIYLAPILTALGLHCWVPGERLKPLQWAGVLLSFSGIAFAFSGGFLNQAHKTWIGDLFGIIGAFLWAATTVLIRATPLAKVSATKTLFYQLAVSALMLPLASIALGEKGIVAWTPLAIGSIAFQSVLVAFASYLAWFWLLTRYLAGRLAVFSFLSPLFGVLSGVLVLQEPLTASFALSALLVGSGIVLVNLRK